MILERQECEQIHGAALEVLERTGVRVDDPEDLQVAGSRRDGGPAAMWRTFHRALVEWAIPATPPRRFPHRRPRRPPVGVAERQRKPRPHRQRPLHQPRAPARRPDLRATWRNWRAWWMPAATSTAWWAPPSATIRPHCRDFVGFRIMARNTAKHLRPLHLHAPRRAARHGDGRRCCSTARRSASGPS